MTSEVSAGSRSPSDSRSPSGSRLPGGTRAGEGSAGGLRERKKARTRVAIRDAAMRLFTEQGFAPTTVEQIAEAADVSPSTFFRYFPTKEDVVLIDDYDPLIAAAIRAQPASTPVIEAVLAGMREVFERLTEDEWASERQRQELFRTVPDLRARQMQQTVAAVDILAGVIAERLGVPSGDEGARALTGALVGVFLTFMYGGDGAGLQPADFDRVKRALLSLRTHLEPL
ncbi:TetR family transcriptional regulator [Paractinoplanes maris]|uniref:TetR family transcriptional regulator n=1 Tax=Paractinoplanes maris TaxID=1734446 RepID=UPI0020203D00|nr:TetR family transcriptional regulator [Actinoplanes maris]